MKKPGKDRRLYKHETALIRAIDLPAAVGLLTRLPLRVDQEKAMARGAGAVWAYPLVGIILGGGIAATVPFLLWAGLPGGIIAGLVLALSIILTGALHEDGLADTADGFWGGATSARRLAIMKDSHIGVYGVCAIALLLLLRWLALVVIVSVGAYWMVLIAVGALSRASIVVLMATLPHARKDGLSHAIGAPRQAPVWIAIAIAVFVAVLCGYAVLIITAIIATVICALIARAKIGGQTGDILGATQQITEVAMLLTAVTLLG